MAAVRAVSRVTGRSLRASNSPFKLALRPQIVSPFAINAVRCFSTQGSAGNAAERAIASVVDHPINKETFSNATVDTFAVVQFPGRQYKVAVDDVINTPKIAGAKVGTKIVMDQVLMVGSKDKTVIGRPVVPGASVTLWVEEQTKDKKVIVFKQRRRKDSRTLQGHRAQISVLRVLEINGGEN